MVSLLLKILVDCRSQRRHSDCRSHSQAGVSAARRPPYRSRHHRSLVAAAASADATVTGASVAIAAQPVGCPGFERVARLRGDSWMMGRMMDRSMPVDLAVCVLARVSRHGAHQHDGKRQRQAPVVDVIPLCFCHASLFLPCRPPRSDPGLASAATPIAGNGLCLRFLGRFASLNSVRIRTGLACAQRRAIKTIMIAAANGEAGQTTHDDPP
jgi:hypothetical protein